MKRIDYVFDLIAAIGTFYQTESVFKIISLSVTILSVIASLSFTIYKWVKASKADGVITADEVGDLSNSTIRALNEIKNAIQNKGGDNDDDNEQRG